ncbi:hypothetical protein BCR35DRAFT_300057 [Leucosporidium creatinivorum]|uniref:F-box domain-containing protein n=1 Tax=Leucosporidium creatinivorum TaxID=106004 RepID=A0A1Y2G107_9BASI|nr:hypothetical protein BCR35DRAFT_300057 [Leucosporidium creatinivorum]
MEGEKLAFVFRPVLLVSKTFYALALPIAARHLFPSAPDDYATATLFEACNHVTRHGLQNAVETAWLPTGTQTWDQQCYFEAFPRLRTLQALEFIINPVELLGALTTRVLQSGGTFKSTKLKALALAAPHLTALSLSGDDRTGKKLPLCLEASTEVIIPNWRLQHLAFHYLEGSKEQALAFITSSSATLQTLKFTLPDTGRWSEPPIWPSPVLNDLDRPLPLLRHLDLGELHPPSRASTFLDRSLLPNLEYLTLPICRRSIRQILSLPLTLIAASLIAVDIKLKASSPLGVDTLKSFIKGRPALKLLSVDCNSTSTSKIDPNWHAELRAECDALDITFASRSLSSTEAEVWTEEEYGGESETEEEIGERRTQEDEALPLDFDAEDDKMWASWWSEEKKEEMGYESSPDAESDSSEACSRPLGFRSAAFTSNVY